MGGQMEEQFNKDVPSEERRARIIEELEKGKNLLISEKYLSHGKWSPERVARDALQNFFDGLGGTLDGVEFNVTQEGEKGIIDIRAEGVVYDFRRLLSLGGGSKTDSLTTAGGEGEGTRMMALHLLRDYGFSKVVFGAGDWEMEFYLAPDEEGVSPQEEDDLLFLHGKIKEKKYENRNYIHFETNKPEIVDEFIKAKDLFRHSGNEDFQHPDFENEKGGFKYHPDERGNFYFNGQQVSTRYDGDLGKNLENLTLWTNKTPSYEGKTLHAGRDREFIAEEDIKNIFIPQFCEEMNKEDLELVLAVLEDSYKKKEVFEESIDVCLLRNIVKQLKKDDSFSYYFNRKYLACDVDKESAKMLSAEGYLVCHMFFKDIGMKTASSEFESFGKDVNVLTREQMESKEIARIKLLEEFISHVLGYSKGEVERMFEDKKGESLPSSFVPKEIRVFVSRHPITGKYDEGEVFLKRELVRGGLADALATYKHELSHKFGSDQSAEFSYALTLLDEKMIAYILDHPEVLVDLKKSWDENEPETLGNDVAVWRFNDAKSFVFGLENNSQNKKINLVKYEKSFYQLRDIVNKRFGGELNTEYFFEIQDAILNHPLLILDRNNLKNEDKTSEEKNELKEMKQKYSVELAEIGGLIREDKKKLTLPSKQREEKKKVIEKRLQFNKEKQSDLEDKLNKVTAQLPLDAIGLFNLYKKMEKAVVLGVKDVNLDKLSTNENLVIAALMELGDSFKEHSEKTGEIISTAKEIVDISRKSTSPGEGNIDRVVKMVICALFDELRGKRKFVEDIPKADLFLIQLLSSVLKSES